MSESESRVSLRIAEYQKLVDRLEVVLVTKENYFKLFSFRPSFKVDLITSQDPFETGLLGWYLSWRLAARLELQIHTDFMSPYFAKESWKNFLRVWLAKFLLTRADCVRVVSKRIADSIGRGSTTIPVFRQPPDRSGDGVNLRKMYPQFSFIVFMASRFSREKNISLALVALAKVVKDHKDIGLVIAGEGPAREELKHGARVFGVEKNVIFLPWMSDLSPLYKSADVFLLTSNYEGYGLALLEASAAGCPIITTDVGLVGEIFTREECIVVPVGSAEKITQAIIQLKKMPQLREALRLRSGEVVSRLPAKEELLERQKLAWQSCVV